VRTTRRVAETSASCDSCASRCSPDLVPTPIAAVGAMGSSMTQSRVVFGPSKDHRELDGRAMGKCPDTTMATTTKTHDCTRLTPSSRDACHTSTSQPLRGRPATPLTTEARGAPTPRRARTMRPNWATSGRGTARLWPMDRLLRLRSARKSRPLSAVSGLLTI